MGTEASVSGNNPRAIDIFCGSGGFALGIGTASHAIAVLPVTLHFRFPTSSTRPISRTSKILRVTVFILGRIM